MHSGGQVGRVLRKGIKKKLYMYVLSFDSKASAASARKFSIKFYIV